MGGGGGGGGAHLKFTYHDLANLCLNIDLWFKGWIVVSFV